MNISVVGTVAKTTSYSKAHQCCRYSEYPAWTWTPPRNCTYYTSVKETVAADGAVSGGISGARNQVLPSWPATSPWVTAVGGTKFKDQVLGGSEVAVDIFGSGGGFSSVFEVPDYQRDVTA